jgi:hypothetical protein
MDRQSQTQEGRPSSGRDVTQQRESDLGVSVHAGVRYGVLAGFATYATAVVFLAIHVFSLEGATVGGIGLRAFAIGTFGDFFGTHYGVTDGVVLGGAGAGTIPVFVYHLVPVVSLSLSGRLCATIADPKSGETAFLQGAAVAAGYGIVVLTLLNILFTTVEVPLLGLNITRAVLLAGIVYPVVFGGLGGYSVRL